MLKRIISLFVLLLLSHLKGMTQSFMQGIGANISILTAKVNTPNEKYTFTMQVNHFSYFPRFNLSETDNTSFSIGFPLGAGIGILTSGGNAQGISWGFDLPIAADYNFGCRSTPDNEKNFGGYFGAGFSYMYTAWNAGDGTEHANSYGPVGRAGIRFSSANARWNVTIGLFFKLGIESEKYKTFGFDIISGL